MNPDNMIEVKDVKKRFKVYFDKGSSIKEKILFRNRNRYEERWVLKGISFEVKKGEAVGLIGKNGCGKSTTLKMLTRIMYPTDGSISLKGRVSSLIELGAGFHPDMSGRENIFTNASIFGLNHKEIEKRLDDIIQFSELEEFIDNPVRTYSSGMYMRLAFAVAINVDADILLIDEILAVGDVSFQAKCFEKLKEIKRNGTTIVIVSHVAQQIKNICDRAIWLEDGVIREDGKPDIVTKHYLESMEEERTKKIEESFQKKLLQKEEQRKRLSKARKDDVISIPDFCTPNAVRKGNMKIRFTDAVLLDQTDKPAIYFKSGETMKLQFYYEADELQKPMNISISITKDDGVYCYGTTALSGTGGRYTLYSKSTGNGIATFEKLNLLEGKYLVDIAIQGIDEEYYDYIGNALEFRIKDDGQQHGMVLMDRLWQIDGISLSYGNEGKIDEVERGDV